MALSISADGLERSFRFCFSLFITQAISGPNDIFMRHNIFRRLLSRLRKPLGLRLWRDHCFAPKSEARPHICFIAAASLSEGFGYVLTQYAAVESALDDVYLILAALRHAAAASIFHRRLR